jgi:hypothetical protein
MTEEVVDTEIVVVIEEVVAITAAAVVEIEEVVVVKARAVETVVVEAEEDNLTVYQFNGFQQLNSSTVKQLNQTIYKQSS